VNLFPNALHVARREYLFRVRGRAFRITTALLALAIIGLTLLPTILGAIGIDDPPTVAVEIEATDLPIDPVSQLQAALLVVSGADPSTSDPEDLPQVTRVEDHDAALASVREGELDALLTIDRSADGEGDLVFEFVGSASPTNQTRLLVTAFATELTIMDRLERAGIDGAEAAAIRAPPEFTATAANPDAATNQDDFGGSFILAYAVVILTFMAILTYGNWVAQSVAEEKSGRVMELLITAATPVQLLSGKVLGTGAAGLTQYVVIIGAVVAGLLANGPIAEALGASGSLPFTMPDLDIGFLLAFTAFFLLGFLLYSTLYAAAGSMVSRIEDVQQAVGPLLFLAMGGYLASFVALNDPDAGWVAVASLVPFFSPYLMPARMLLSSPPPFEIGLAIALLVVVLVASIWIAARIYSAGVLLYGQRVGIRTVFRATRVPR
jgi:ABC-2 type transport system permease protein